MCWALAHICVSSCSFLLIFLCFIFDLGIRSCFDVDFSQMLETWPRTLFFQGAGDMIVHESQSQYFKNRIKNFRLEIFKNCGHAPQLSDVERMRKVILEEIDSF